jgi:hypothetical protein
MRTNGAATSANTALIFFDAASIFDGEFVAILDDRIDYGEARYIAFGLLRGKTIKVIVVAYTERGRKIRLISARKALKHEESFYFEQITD